MKYNRLGNSGLKVSNLSLGSWLTFGNDFEKDKAIEIIRHAYELGINSFDTANYYGFGQAEKVMAEALEVFPREHYVLATKAFFPMSDKVNDSGLSKKHIIEQVNNSLKRLKTDYIDLFYCHRFDEETPIEETLAAIDILIRQGKILYYGVSEWSGEQIEKAIEISDRKNIERMIVNQSEYSMFKRDIEKEVIPKASELGVKQVVYSPLAQGVLTGKYRLNNKVPSNSRAANKNINKYMQKYMSEGHLRIIEELLRISQELDIELSQLALSWLLNNENISSAIVGASRKEQLDQNVKASEFILNEEIVNRINSILTQI